MVANRRPIARRQLDELIREGARRTLLTALEAEVQDYIERHEQERGEDGRKLVVRNGKAKPREITTAAGPMEVAAPRVNDKRVVDGERQKFTSQILPPYMRRSPKVAEVLPILYLLSRAVQFDAQPPPQSHAR